MPVESLSRYQRGLIYALARPGAAIHATSASCKSTPFIKAGIKTPNDVVFSHAIRVVNTIVGAPPYDYTSRGHTALALWRKRALDARSENTNPYCFPGYIVTLCGNDAHLPEDLRLVIMQARMAAL